MFANASRSGERRGSATGGKGVGGLRADVGNRIRCGSRPRRRPEEDRGGAAGRPGSRPRGGSPGKGSGSSDLRTVNLRIHTIECVKTTKEIDRDEIVLTVVQSMGAVENQRGENVLVGKSTRGGTIDAGKFKKGVKQRYRPAKTIAQFPLGDRSGDWPRYFPATLLLIEQDREPIGQVVAAVIDAIDDKLVRAVRKAVTTVATQALAGLAASSGVGASVGSVVPLVGTAIGAAAGAAIAAGLAAIEKSRDNDVFPAKSIQLELDASPSKQGVITGSKKTATFSAFKGEYKVVYSWSVS